MNPAVKYTLGRIGLFVLITAMLIFVTPLNPLVDAMIGFLVSAALSYFLLADWRNQMAGQLASASERRVAEKQRLRAALAGDEDAAAEGDRAAVPAAAADRKTAAADRKTTAADRKTAAADRKAAEADREAAEADREADREAAEATAVDSKATAEVAEPAKD